MGCKLTLKDVRHAPNLCHNLMLGFVLDKQGYEATLAKTNRCSLRAHWFFQKEKNAALCTRPKGKFVKMSYML